MRRTEVQRTQDRCSKEGNSNEGRMEGSKDGRVEGLKKVRGMKEIKGIGWR